MSEPYDETFRDGEDSGGTTVAPVVVQAPLLTLDEQAALEQAPKLSDRPGWGLDDIAGKVWNSPNTLLGALYGGLGMVVGEAGHLLGLQRHAPSVQWRDNALQFTNNPFGGAGAITIGNTTTWSGDPYDAGDTGWRYPDGRPKLENGHSYPDHEYQHTIQGQQLGPLYLPSNLAGGLTGLFLDRKWHGDHNWNERGPQANPPRPWKAYGP